jgi:hypothetical protein
VRKFAHPGDGRAASVRCSYAVESKACVLLRLIRTNDLSKGHSFAITPVVTEVQISIPDEVYAEELGRLLTSDGKHRVHIVEEPDPAMDGVLVVDEALAGCITLADQIDPNRCIVWLANNHLDADKLWTEGFRRLVHADCFPSQARLVVLATEMQLRVDAESAHTPLRAIAPPNRHNGHELREQLRDLQNAVSDAIWRSDWVAKALNALQGSKRDVQIEIDTVLVNEEPTESGSWQSSIFDGPDRTVLQTLGISEP